VPVELSVLTLAEHLLISMYFLMAYVFKLYPKQVGSASWNPDQLYDGMKGNVSTYPLDPQLVAGMLDGKLFPAPPEILCCTIAVTFITPSGQRMKTLPSELCVRRAKVYEALCWLKKNNPVYADIIISNERLHHLLEDDIPMQIVYNVRESNDIDAVIREHEGYVPVDVADDEVQGTGNTARGPRRGDEAEATDSIVGPNKVIGESLHGRIIKRALKTSL